MQLALPYVLPFAQVLAPETPCIEWAGSIGSNGYGRKYDPRKQNMGPAHRLLYEAEFGPIPDGLVIDHLCRDRAYVNLDHLEVVTSGENVLRGESLAARNLRKTHCLNGHPLSGDNLRLLKRPDGKVHRNCRECGNAQRRVARLVS